MQKSGGVLAGIGVIAIFSVALLAASFPMRWWNISLEELRSKYERPASQFVTLDGAEIHFQDEGNPEGVPVVLLHGNFASLRTYDEWVPILGKGYRLIRFDNPLSGLSDRDPSGDYTIERRIFLMLSLLEHLDVENFFLVATSYNAPTAFRTAARRPGRVLGLVLGNGGGLPRTADNNPNRPDTNRLKNWLHQYYYPRRSFETTLVRLLPDPRQRTEAVIEQFHLMINAERRPSAGMEVLRQFDSQDAQAYLERITVPVLLQWTIKGNDSLLVDKDLARYRKWLSNASVQSIEYNGAGHMLYQNAPEATATDAREFFDKVMLLKN